MRMFTVKMDEEFMRCWQCHGPIVRPFPCRRGCPAPVHVGLIKPDGAIRAAYMQYLRSLLPERTRIEVRSPSRRNGHE